MKRVRHAVLSHRRPVGLAIAASFLLLSSLPLLAASDGEPAPLGVPPVIEHPTPNSVTEIAQRLLAFPFAPPDARLKDEEPLSGSNDWFTRRDKKKIDELGSLDFYEASGDRSVGVVPKLHNTSAGIEIYQLAPPLTKEAFEKNEGPYRSGITKKFRNKRSGKKVAKFKVGNLAESGLAAFYLSRILGHLVEVPPATYRTMDVQEFTKVSNQARTTGHPSCTEAWASLRAAVKAGSARILLPDGKLAYGSLAENPRGEDSSPEDYWTVSAIRGHSFYKVLSSKSPVANVVNLNDPKCLQDLALAQDLTRGVILDSIFRQVDRLGNISIAELQHYVTDEGKVKWDDNPSDKDKAEAASPFHKLKRIVYKDNDDGMLWNVKSLRTDPILEETHHLDRVIYDRLQWLSGLMQEAGSNEKVKDYFVNAVHISPANYDGMKASVIKYAALLKTRVNSRDIQLDLDFEGTMKKLYAKKAEAEPIATPTHDPGASPTPMPPVSNPPDSASTDATVDPGPDGEPEVISHTSPGGVVELATRPAGFPGHPEIYSRKDIEKEKELAGIDFYNGKTRDGLDIVVIPKTYSTSPGLNIHAVKLASGVSRLSYAATHATKALASETRVIAKYKQSIPTHFTYSPSILGYYHLSRFLDAGRVEPAIVRTMDVAAHKPLADIGKAKAAGSNNRNQWTELRALDDAHNHPALYTKDGRQLFGALQANPTGEEKYPRLSDLAGASAFAASSEFGKAGNPSSLKLTYKGASGKLNQPAVQQLAQVKDLSEMVLMDFIMSQADRFSGNMHSRQTYLWIENGVLKEKARKSDSAKAADQLKEIPPEAVLVNRIIMKDNDAGLISGNLAKSNHLLEKIGHLDPSTYNRLLDLQRELTKPEVSQWYQAQLLFTPADFKTLQENVDQAVAILSARKDRNLLLLDASLSDVLGARQNIEPEPGGASGPGVADSTPILPVLTASVGRWEKGAANVQTDVEAVQRLLTAAAKTLKDSQLNPGGVDGKIARPPAKSNTVSAIEAFQKHLAGAVDGLIVPGSETWNQLLKTSEGT